MTSGHARLMTELLLAYDRQLDGDSAGAVPLATRYRDFVAAEQAAVGDPAAERFWRDALAELPAAPLPVRAASPPAGYRAELPRELDAALRRVAADARLPLKSVYLAAHLWSVRQLTGDPVAVTGVQVNGRPERPDADRALGLFLNRLDGLRRLHVRDWWSADLHSFGLMVEVVTEPRSGRRALVVSVGVDSPLSGTDAEWGELFRWALEQIAADPTAAYPTAVAADGAGGAR
jgi:hypothetical protein